MDMQLCWSWFFLMRYSHPEIPQPILTEHKLSNSNWNIFSPAQKITFHSKSADKKHLHFHPHISTEVISTITFIFRLNHNFFWLMAWNAVRVHLLNVLDNFEELCSTIFSTIVQLSCKIPLGQTQKAKLKFFFLRYVVHRKLSIGNRVLY